MPKVSGKELISDSTEKALNKLLLFASAGILAKTYEVPLGSMKLLSAEMPAAIFDVTLLGLTLYFLYTYIIKWIGDLMAFRLWYRETSIWSNFGTNMKLDKMFISGGVDLLKILTQLDKANAFPTTFDKLDEEARKKYEDLKTNIELYALRLGSAGTKFRCLSAFGHYYVWVQCFLFPLVVSLVALYLLIKYGQFSPPKHF
jgi:hypothetical protein